MANLCNAANAKRHLSLPRGRAIPRVPVFRTSRLSAIRTNNASEAGRRRLHCQLVRQRGPFIVRAQWPFIDTEPTVDARDHVNAGAGNQCPQELRNFPGSLGARLWINHIERYVFLPDNNLIEIRCPEDARVTPCDPRVTTCFPRRNRKTQSPFRKIPSAMDAVSTVLETLWT